MIRLRVLWESLTRLIAFIPIIWKHRDWDWAYSLILFRFSLSRLEKGLRLYGRHTTSKQSAQQIRRVLVIIDRLVENDYCKKEFEIFRTRYPDTKDWFHPYSAKELRAIRSIHKKEARLIKADWNRLWFHLSKNLTNWWH